MGSHARAAVHSSSREERDMMSNLGTRAAPDLQRELARAYDGDVPPPYYWQLPASPPPAHGRRHPGEIPTALPYSVLSSRS